MPMASASPFRATIFAPMSASTSIIGEMREACARTGAAGTAAGRQRPFRRRASGGLHAGDRLAGLRCFVAARPRQRRPIPFPGLFDLAPLVETSINTRLAARCRRRQGRKPAVLESARGRAASMRWWAKTKARSIFGKAGPSSRSGARPASRPGSAWFAGANHFTAIAPLADPGSPMVPRLKQLAGR